LGAVPHLDPVSGEPQELADLLRAWDQERSPQPLVVETSGSTGRPKRVRLARSAMRASVDATHGYLGGRGQWLLALPAHHVAGLQVLYRNVRGRHDLVVVGDSWADAVASMTGPRRYTSVVPTQLVRLLDKGEVEPLTRLDAVLVGGGPLDPARRREALDAGVRVVMTYGMSETCGGCVYDGHPLDGVAVKIAGDGEVVLAGPMLFDGYDDGRGGVDEAATAAVRRHGWFHTADHGRLDADGRLQVLGRRDQVVVSGGLNVPGPAVERMLARAPGLRDVAVVGVPDEEWGELVTAVVVTGGGAEPELSRLRELVEPREWAPRAVVVVDELPRTHNDKVDRAAVRRLAAARSGGRR
jgi:O-succinylbenzoic acid--CoA ligase